MERFRQQEQRFAALRETLEYGVYHVVAPLEMDAHISSDPVPFAEREKLPGRKMMPGEHWGDLFQCGWFHFTGIVPQEYRGSHVVILVDLSAEGLVVDGNGNPVQGLTSATSRNEFPLGLWGKRTIELKDCSADGENIDFWTDFTCCDVEGQYRNSGRIKEACIAVVDDLCRDAFYDWQICQSLFVGLWENNDPYGEEVGTIMERAASCLTPAASLSRETSVSGQGTEEQMKSRDNYGEDRLGLDRSQERLSVWPDPETEHTRKFQHTLDRESLRAVREILSEILEKPNENPAMTYSAIGHSHLDLLFLWPERETYRKCARTMSNVLKMMDRYPDFKFCLSQAPVYIWMKEQYPDLYRRMLEKIREGRIEVVGAFWIECDTNLPGGESLVRQLLYGKRFFRQEFGMDMKVGFLPDVFGYSAALPQLFQKSDVPYFTTNKLSMNDTNRFPRYTFWWYGMDGTKILTHMPPENSYTSAAVPQMALYGQHHYTDIDLCQQGLELFGLGDGGGGPGYEHMERRKRCRNLKGCPPFEDEFVVDFFRRIEKRQDSYRSWHGELYFERHQGTYTSIAKQKKWNRTLERDLHDLEWLAVMARARTGMEYPSDWLKKCWQDVMLYQFHDCLPGSSIAIVYQQTQERYAQLHREAWERIGEIASSLAESMDCANMALPTLAANPTSFARQERLVRDGREMEVTLAPYEIRIVDWAEAEPAEEREIPNDLLLENAYLRLRFTERGTVSSLLDKAASRELLPEGSEGNRLVLFPDELTHWDIEKNYLNAEPVPAVMLRAKKTRIGSATMLHLWYCLGERSAMEQLVILKDGERRADFRTTVDWQEEYRMLRVQWPVDVITDTATCDIQFGSLRRPTHQNTTWDYAKFEVCAHKWVDMADRSGGLALLNDCKYGYKIWDNVLDLCLLRSQNCPCEHGDQGVHSFTYGVYPHTGDIWEGGVVRQGYLLNDPVLLLPVEGHRGGTEGVNWITMNPDTPVVLETVKKAEDSGRTILRFYEAAGGVATLDLRLTGYRAVGLCNLLEEPLSTEDFVPTEDGAKIRFHPFEVQSLIVEKK